MKEFQTAARQAVTEDDLLKFKLDGVELISRRPSEGQIVFLMAAEASEVRTEASKMAGMVDFSLSIFDGPSRRHLGSRLIDPEDDFSFEQLMEIVQYVIEEWGNRPTKPSSDSTSSPESGGSNSADGAQSKELTSFSSTQPAPVT